MLQPKKYFIDLSKAKKKKLPKTVCLSTINNTLNKYISKPKKVRKVFILTESQKAKRFEFLKFMNRKQITPEDILFSDESIFYLSFFNGNCKVRIW